MTLTQGGRWDLLGQGPSQAPADGGILWTVPPAIPPVIGLLPDVVLGAHFLHRRPGLRLPHDPYNLFHCESTLFHFVLLSLLKQNYTYVMSSFLGSGQGEPRRDPRVAVGEAAEGIARAGDPPERIAGLDCKSGLLHENNQSREQSRFLLVFGIEAWVKEPLSFPG